MYSAKELKDESVRPAGFHERFRQMQEQRENEKNLNKTALDDGSVKGLILTSDDSKHLGMWTDFNVDAETAEITGNCTLSEDNAFEVVTACRRKFKKEDIVLCNFTNSTNSGIVLTEDKIYSFDDGKLEYIIEYAEIKDVDFDTDSITVKVLDGQEAVILCDSGEDYSKHWYSLIMDIKDRVNESQTVKQ